MGTCYDLETLETNNYTPTPHIILASFYLIGLDEIGYITNVYGPHLTLKKNNFLQNLKNLGPILVRSMVNMW